LVVSRLLKSWLEIIFTNPDFLKTMKLELESTAATLQSPFAANDLSAHGFDAAKINEMLKAGIDAAKQGNRAEARMLLLRVTESQPDNETAWLWLASISEYPEELLVFLSNVLNINPHNERALEWAKATKSLLAKTFVQRGITASRENQKDFASQCFQQALAHDETNELAWMWLASVADSPEEKTARLEKVLALNPENETAQASLKAVRQQMSQALLKKANVAAISGEHEAARRMLDELMNLSPEMEEAWILKAYLSEGHEEKIACFEKVLTLNPENETAQAGIDSLNAIRQRELERAEQNAKLLERLQTEAQAKAQTAFTEEVPELYFDFNSAAQEQSAEEEYPDFTHAEEAEEEDDIHKTSTANQSDENFVQDGPTQELEEEFVQNLEAQSSFMREPESEPDDENPQESQEFFAAENAEENHSAPEFSGLAAETEEFATETAQDVQSEPVSASQAETNAYESKDFEIMTPENSYTQFEESSPAGGFESLEEETVMQQSFASNNGHYAENDFQENNADRYEQENEPNSEAFPQTQFLAPEIENSVDGDFETEDEIEEICVAEDETLDNYFHVEDESDDKHFDETAASEPYEEDENPVAAKSVSQAAASFECPFCNFANEPQSFVCPSCQAVLTLSDLEMLLSNSQANRETLTEAIERMESEMEQRSFNSDELTSLGIAHLNAKNLRQGYSYLQQASQMNQNNVVLGGQVNALAIRLDEIEQHESKTQEAKSCTILVVDDSPTVRKLISGKLEKSGHTVVLAVDGMDALAKINEVVPDLVLLDITMPRMDGYQVCKLIRNNNLTKDIPVVMISGKDGFFDKVRGRMAGSTGYITKPFGPDTLMRTIDAYLN
jgi:twitching motility two-component system response regulator PilG